MVVQLLLRAIWPLLHLQSLYDYEAGRGVDQISPMKPICGHSRVNFDNASPLTRLWKYVAKFREHDDDVNVCDW